MSSGFRRWVVIALLATAAVPIACGGEQRAPQPLGPDGPSPNSTVTGKPLDPKRARKILDRDRDRGAEAALGLGGPAPEAARPMKVWIVLDATKNLWVKGQDLNVEVGLSPDFRVELGEETDLFGEVRIIRGRLDVLGRRFDFQRNSVVRFTGPPTEPP